MMQDASVRRTIAGLGRKLGPETLATIQALYADEQEAIARQWPPLATDLAYGEHPRQRLDLYAPCEAAGPLPILVWVHGGGFLRGAKSAPDNPFNAHVGRLAARNGMLGVVINYRLAPEALFPAGGEDVGLVVDWLKANAAQHGGDPDRIFLAGTSAGAVHVATHLMLRGAEGLAGAILLSGLYGATALEAQDQHYVKADRLLDWERLIDAVAGAGLPLFVACAEHDPVRFQAETLALLKRRYDARGELPRVHFGTGHNHYSLAFHLGSAGDTRLADEILAFVADCTKGTGT